MSQIDFRNAVPGNSRYSVKGLLLCLYLHRKARCNVKGAGSFVVVVGNPSGNTSFIAQHQVCYIRFS